MAETIVRGRYIQHTAAGDGAGVKNRTKVLFLIWAGFTDGAHTLQVKDGNGTIVIPAFACGNTAANIGPIIMPLGKVLQGVETDVLGSGTVQYITE